MTDQRSAATARGEGVVLGSPGVYHYPVLHEYRPSNNYGFGISVTSLCGRTSGIVYDEGRIRGMWPKDRLCRWCERIV